MIDSNRIKGRMTELEITQESAAKAIGIDPATFNKKVNARNGACFTVDEANALGDLLGWDQIEKGTFFFVNHLA